MFGPPPFVLLDDMRPDGGAARLYRNPAAVIVARQIEEVRPALAEVRAGIARGLHAAGWIAYEAAPAFEPAIAQAATGEGPFLWLGLFDTVERIDPAALASRLPDPAGACCGRARPRIDRAEYEARFRRVQSLIRAGDLYQANLTYRADMAVDGDPLALYARLRSSACAGYGAVIATGETTLLSLSPELFFARDGNRITARPMKGTAAREPDPAADTAAAEALAEDPKQRAENLMIVDLMRNDLARIALPGTVAVPRLFEVESYPTVHQLTSTVTARVPEGRDALDALVALFPCGSITGAPKIRAIAALADVEGEARGVYSGAIGWIDPDGDACFSVAIRTLVMAPDGTRATIGLGGGIVADSDAEAEWNETLAKAAFLTANAPRVDLVETMAFDPMRGLLRLDAHLARMRASADRLGFVFDRHATRNELQAATFRLRGSARVRLVLARSGAIAIEISAAPPVPASPVAVAIAQCPLPSRDFRLAHKTTDRAAYNAARAKAGAFEVIFTDRAGYLTEGSFTSIFVRRGDILITPPRARGLLPGVLRGALIEEGRAREGDLKPADLDHGFFIGNAVRGLLPAQLVAPALGAAL